jgi:hypothetical protein
MIDAQRLWLAVLEQGVIDFVSPAKKRRARVQYFTQLWLTSDDQEPGSFRWICILLTLIRDSAPGLHNRPCHPVSSRPQFWHGQKRRMTRDR